MKSFIALLMMAGTVYGQAALDIHDPRAYEAAARNAAAAAADEGIERQRELKRPDFAARQAERFDQALDQMKNARTPTNRRAGGEALLRMLRQDRDDGRPVPAERVKLAAAAFADRLGHDDLDLRKTSLDALRAFGSEAQLSKLRDTLKRSGGFDDGWPVAIVIAKLGDSKTAIAYVERFTRGEPSRDTVNALAEIGGDEGRAALERLAKRSPKSRSQIDAALDVLDGRGN